MDGEVAESVRRVKTARQALGEGIDIMVDATGRLTSPVNCEEVPEEHPAMLQ